MARYARVCTLSVDGTVVLPEAEPIEDLQTPCVVTKPAVPLRHSWCVPSFLFLQYFSTDVLLHRTIYISQRQCKGALRAHDSLGQLVFGGIRGRSDDGRRFRRCGVVLLTV